MLEQILTMGFFTAFFSAMVRMAVPLIYAGLGEMFAEKAGILNIGMEGVMLSGAFCSFAGAMFSGSLMIGLLCGILGGIAVGMIHAVLSIKLAQNQSVSGIAINMFVLGVTSFFSRILKEGKSYQQLTTVFYAKTAKGLAFQAVGEHPRAADAAGIPVHKYQYIAMLVNGILGGIGGAYLVLVQLGVFTENMISGRGYIALATVILGRYTPFGMFGAALLFGAANALQIRLQTIGVSISPFLLAICHMR